VDDPIAARPRREFLTGLTALTALPFIDGVLPPPARRRQDVPRLPDPFTPEEARQVEVSDMARDMPNFAGHGYNCAECACLTGLRYLGRSEEEGRVALGFGGGLGQGELCGLLTGGFMALGAAAGARGADREAARRHARNTGAAFWQWWTERAPIACRELRREYDGQDEFLRMTQRVAVKVQQLIDAID